MKIEFEGSARDYQDAGKLREILTSCRNPGSGQDTSNLIDPLIQQIDHFLANKDTDEKATSGGILSSFWQALAGPSNRELTLSKQRQELVERAEHAEAMAFEALAETADVGKERDEALKKLKQLEEEITKLKVSQK